MFILALEISSSPRKRYYTRRQRHACLTLEVKSDHLLAAMKPVKVGLPTKRLPPYSPGCGAVGVGLNIYLGDQGSE